ncbi:hypothetical protein [Halosimplex sp. TS25]|uniref:hypothetical protein n=1 Tax=Halosimplex rarum TaxID=3396619 RepID=UPI0039EB2F85
MRWRLLLALAVVVTAGCGSLVGADERPDAATDTLTPAPIPEVTPTPERWGVAPGLTGNSVADLDALVAAHRAATANRSYVWRERRGSTTGPNGSVPLFNRTVAQIESQSVYHVRAGDERVRLRSGTTTVADYSEYADGTDRFVRYRHVGRRDYERERRHPIDPNGHPHIGLSAAGAIERYLDVESAAVAAVTVDDRRHYEVVAHNWSRADDDRVSGYAVTAVVSPAGFVRSLDVSYTVHAAGQSRRVRYAFAYERVGETTVDPPEWYAEEN